MFYLGIFGIKFEKTIVASKIGSLEYVQMQNVKEKEGRLTVGPNMPPHGYLISLSGYLVLSNQYRQIR